MYRSFRPWIYYINGMPGVTACLSDGGGKLLAEARRPLKNPALAGEVEPSLSSVPSEEADAAKGIACGTI